MRMARDQDVVFLSMMLSRQESTACTKLGLGSAHCVILQRTPPTFIKDHKLRIGGIVDPMKF